MRSATTILLAGSLILTNGCSSSNTNETPQNAAATSTASSSATPESAASTGTSSTTPATAKMKISACSLLTTAEIKAVQGEALKEAKGSERASGNFLTSICYYELPTSSNSISLSLTESDTDKRGGQSVKQFWETTFGRGEEENKKDRAEKKAEPRGEEEEEGAPLTPVRGIGEEAFWSGSRVGGALYVLKGDHYIRISIGGKGNNEAKLERSKKLAQKALKRL